MNFKMPGKVYRNAMSPIARSHMLIAAGTEDVQVRLCDIASGAFAHTLSGHRGMMIVLRYLALHEVISSMPLLFSSFCNLLLNYQFWYLALLPKQGILVVIDDNLERLALCVCHLNLHFNCLIHTATLK